MTDTATSIMVNTIAPYVILTIGAIIAMIVIPLWASNRRKQIA